MSDDLGVKVADKARTTTESCPFLAFSVAWILPANPSPLPAGEGMGEGKAQIVLSTLLGFSFTIIGT